METRTLDRIQLIREAAERLKNKDLETRAEQQSTTKNKKVKRKQVTLRTETNTEHDHYVAKGGVRSTHQTYGHAPTMDVFIESHGMTSIKDETRDYRHDY